MVKNRMAVLNETVWPVETHQAEAGRWFAIQTRYRFEKRVAAQLRAKGIETFLPLRNEMHRWSDRQKTVEVPLFPGYAFVKLERSSIARLGVLHTEGVIGFVGYGCDAAPVPAKQIEGIRNLLAQKVPCSLYPFLKTGQRVRIRGGCLDGLEGILDLRDEKRLVISIECIQRSLSLKIKGYELDLV